MIENTDFYGRPLKPPLVTRREIGGKLYTVFDLGRSPEGIFSAEKSTQNIAGSIEIPGGRHSRGTKL